MRAWKTDHMVWTKMEWRQKVQAIPQRWTRWNARFDRLDDFASKLGAGLADQVDTGLVAFGLAICGLVMLTLG